MSGIKLAPPLKRFPTAGSSDCSAMKTDFEPIDE